MSMKQQWQIELQNAFCFKTFLAHDIIIIIILTLSSWYQYYHHLRKKKNTDNYKTALSSEHHLSPTLAWLSVKFLWAFSLRVTFNVHNLNGFYLFKNFSPLGIDSMICFQTQWILSIFSWIFINRFEPSMTVDHKKTITTKNDLIK